MTARCLHGATCLHCRLDALTHNTTAATADTPTGELLTWNDAATRLGVSDNHLADLIRAAGLEQQVVTGIGRGRKLRAATLEQLIAAHTKAGAR